MGVFRPLVNHMQRPEGYVSDIEPSDKLITPATIVSASRVEFAVHARNFLLEGKKGAAELAMLAFATDALDGWLARFISDKRPKSNLGVSKFGETADIVADSLALLIIAEGALRGPKVSKLGKAAIGAVVLQEGTKALWAAKSSYEYKQVSGEQLQIPVSLDGKEAMVEKMIGVGLAVWTNEFENPGIRLSLGCSALAFSGVGAWRGEKVRQEYEPEFMQLMDEYLAMHPDVPILGNPLQAITE